MRSVPAGLPAPVRAWLPRYIDLLRDRGYSPDMPVAVLEKPATKSELAFITENDLVLIKAGARQLKFAPGDVLIKQDSSGGVMFFLRSGAARIEANGTTLARIGPG